MRIEGSRRAVSNHLRPPLRESVLTRREAPSRRAGPRSLGGCATAPLRLRYARSRLLTANGKGCRAPRSQAWLRDVGKQESFVQRESGPWRGRGCLPRGAFFSPGRRWSEAPDEVSSGARARVVMNVVLGCRHSQGRTTAGPGDEVEGTSTLSWGGITVARAERRPEWAKSTDAWHALRLFRLAANHVKRNRIPELQQADRVSHSPDF